MKGKRKRRVREREAVEVVEARGRGLNEYEGWSPCVDSSGEKRREVEREREELDWDSMFSRYVVKRKPVVIEGHPKDEGWRVTERWTQDYLSKNAGDATVSVEYRPSLSNGFGLGNRTRMKLKDVLDKIGEGSEQYYLTSQDTKDGNLFTSPLTELHEKRDFPLRPEVLKGLVPANISLWMGSSTSKSSSGLHHDYHDNLYILLSGSKTFTIFSPKYTVQMRTFGAIERVHRNGRINYRGRETHADGSTTQDRCRAEIKQKVFEAERELLQLEDEGCQDSGRLEAAEEKLQEALDLELSLLEEEEEEEEEDMGKDKSAEQDAARSSHPDNFSRLSKEEQEKLKTECGALEINLNAGDMLYLPCGWFHNVSSANTTSNYHLAFNYWFYRK